jgi:ABC-type antimicrobial peptide transport system permease subunit
VLDYSVLQRRRELGIRIAVGASGNEIAKQVSMGVFIAVLTGAVLGGAVALLLEPQVGTLLYNVKPSDLGMLGVPLITVVLTTLLTAVPAVIRGMRIDPVEMLRAE